MRFFDYFRLSFKNLSRQKARTILTVIAITVGSLSLIIMASVIITIKQTLTDQFKQLGAFDLVTVIKDPNSTDNSLISGGNGDPSEGKLITDATLADMRALPHVSEATGVLSSFGIGSMKLQGQDKKAWSNVMAYDPNSDVFNIPVAYGRKLTADDMDKIVIGSGFLDNIGYKGNRADLVGKTLLLNYKMGGNNAPDWGAPPVKPPANADKDWYEAQNKLGLDITATIVGVTGNSTLDNGQSYITMAWGRRLMTMVSWQYPDCKNTACDSNPVMTLVKQDNFIDQGYSSIIIKADSEANITTIADAVKKLGYGATTAQTMLDQINKILLIISIVLAVIGGISLFVATIGIVNTMVMATYERTKEIGVLRACGATRATIRRLFMAEAATLGFLGGLFGLIISLGLGQIASFIIKKYGSSLGSLPIDHINSFPWWLIVSVIAFTSLLGMVSGLFPAIRAARMNPVEALRDE